MPGFDETELPDREMNVLMKLLKGDYIPNPVESEKASSH